MIKISDGKIGTREFASIVLLTIGIKFTDTTPSILFALGKNAAWMMPLFTFLIVLVPFLVLLSLIKKHNLGLMELVYALMGKSFGIITGFVLFLILLGATVLNSRSYVDIVNTIFYQKTPVPYLLLMMMAVSYFVANRGFETIGRSAWIIIPYVVPIAFLLFLFVRETIDLFHLFPLAGPGFAKLIKDSATHSTIFGEIIYLSAFYPFVRNHRSFRIASFIGFAFSALELALFTALYVMVFDYPAVEHLTYPFQDLTRAAAIGETIAHVEAVFLGFWVISAVIHFAVYLYITAFLFARTLHLNEFEPLLLPITGLVVLLALIPPNLIAANQYREILLKSSSGVLMILPFLLWILDRWKGRAKIESS